MSRSAWTGPPRHVQRLLAPACDCLQAVFWPCCYAVQPSATRHFGLEEEDCYEGTFFSADENSVKAPAVTPDMGFLVGHGMAGLLCNLTYYDTRLAIIQVVYL